MPRRLKTSKALKLADRRLLGLKKISETLDLGHGVTISAYQAVIAEQRSILDRFNATLVLLDDLDARHKIAEAKTAEWNSRTLSGVSSKWGAESQQYITVGGTPPSVRKAKERATRAAKAQAKMGGKKKTSQ